jgi:hypothetical protein
MTTVFAAVRAVKVFPVVEKAGAFKATVPLVVDESFVHTLATIKVKLRLNFFSFVLFFRN